MLSIVLGTFNRKELLKGAIESIRKTTEGVQYEIVVVDGGSTDGSREWLAAQDDVALIGQRGPLRGAVRAFNHGFHYAIESGAKYIGHVNDDIVCETDGMWKTAIDMLEDGVGVGAIAFAFDTWQDRGYTHDCIFGNPYVNYGVFKTEAVRDVARSQGDPGGHKLWNEFYHTYAADTEVGVWMAKLGYKIVRTKDIKIHDMFPQDKLRENNAAQGDAGKFYERWAEMKTPTQRKDFPGADRIHLGCGTKRLTGWLNCDGNPDVNPDYVLDSYDMTHVPSGIARQIYTSHMIEHLHPDRLGGFLRECFRILRKTGVLTIATIDFPKIYENRYKTASNGSAWNAALYGETNSTDHPMAAHRQAFDFETLERILTSCGFSRIKEWSPTRYQEINRMNDFAVSCRQVSVLIEGTK